MEEHNEAIVQVSSIVGTGGRRSLHVRNEQEVTEKREHELDQVVAVGILITMEQQLGDERHDGHDHVLMSEALLGILQPAQMLSANTLLDILR